jgi:dethiobiotin synthetase
MVLPFFLFLKMKQMHKVLITGIGTDVGKTVVAAIVTKALQATYFKPIQCGIMPQTDAALVNTLSQQPTLQEAYCLQLPASPHIAATAENIVINIDKIANVVKGHDNNLVVEGAGGIMVPINASETFLDIAEQLQLPTIIVSRNYLGSINHSLLTAAALKTKVKKLCFLFNDNFMQYEEDIVRLSGIESIGHIDFCKEINNNFITSSAKSLTPKLLNWLQ